MKSDIIEFYHPDTGRKIKVRLTNAYFRKQKKEYERLVEDGRFDDPSKLPDINRFIYVQNDDYWIRIDGTKYESLIEKGYKRTKDRLVERTIYNTGETQDSIIIDKNVSNKIIELTDILAIILSLAAKNDIVTYCRIRTTCTRFLNVIDFCVDYNNLLVTLMTQKDRRRFIKGSSKVYLLPEKMIRSYVRLYPNHFIKYCFGYSSSIYWFQKFMGDEVYKQILHDNTLKQIEKVSRNSLRISIGNILRIVQVLDIPERMKKIGIEVKFFHDKTIIVKRVSLMVLKDKANKGLLNPYPQYKPVAIRVDPETGKKIEVGGERYNELKEKNALDILPDISNFLYCGVTDTWVRKGSINYKIKVRNRYEEVDRRLVLKRNTYKRKYR